MEHKRVDEQGKTAANTGQGQVRRRAPPGGRGMGGDGPRLHAGARASSGASGCGDTIDSQGQSETAGHRSESLGEAQQAAAATPVLCVEIQRTAQRKAYDSYISDYKPVTNYGTAILAGSGNSSGATAGPCSASTPASSPPTPPSPSPRSTSTRPTPAPAPPGSTWPSLRGTRPPSPGTTSATPSGRPSPPSATRPRSSPST